MFYISKKELNSFPFDKLYEFVQDRTIQVAKQLKEDAYAIHLRDVKRRIELIYSTREDSYEGNLDEDFPFKEIDPKVLQLEKLRVRKEAAALWLEKYDAKVNSAWLLPQIFAYVAKMPISRNGEGKIDSKLFAQNFAKDDWHKGLYFYLTHPARGDLVNKQYAAEGRSYSALVPLVLAPFKKFDNILYKDWSLEGLEGLVDSALWAAMNTDFNADEIPASEILAMREIGLDVKSGTKVGTKRNPVTTHKLYGVGAPYNKLHWLAQAMLFQIWCAHPLNRSPLAVLSWSDWDSVPTDLISKEVFVEPKTKVRVEETMGLPWE